MFSIKGFMLYHDTSTYSSWQGCAARGTLSKEDAAFICIEALDAIPQKGFIFEVSQNYTPGKGEG